MSDSLKTLLEGQWHRNGPRYEKFMEILNQITDQDVIKLLTFVPHQDESLFEEEAIKKITDIDFLKKLGNGSFRMTRSSSNTWSICERRIEILLFINKYGLDESKANTSYGTQTQNGFTHFLSKIMDAEVRFFTNEIGGYWMLTLKSGWHRNKTEFVVYNESRGRFVQQVMDGDKEIKYRVLGVTPEESFQELIDQYNKKRDSMLSKDDDRYKLKIMEINSKHFITSF